MRGFAVEGAIAESGPSSTVEKPIFFDIAAKQRPLHEAIGQGLTAYSQAEALVGAIFERLLHPAPGGLAMIALDAVQITSPKFRVVRAVAKARLGEDLYKQLNKALQRVEACGDMRIKLAHWVVSIWHPDKMPIESFDEKIEMRLVPPWFSAKNLSFSPSDTVSLKEITDFIGQCGRAGKALIDVHMKIQAAIPVAAT